MSRHFLKRLLTQMLWIRSFEEKIAEKYPEQEMRCPVHLSIGQEAVAVGACAALKQTDVVFSGHRAHAHYLAKGGDPYGLIAEIYGRESGCSRGRGGSMHLIDLKVNFLGSVPIVASILPIATGVAYAEKMNRKDTVTTAFLGEAAIEQGVFHEIVNFATLKKLPIIYVCENNLYAVYTPLSERQPNRSITKLVEGHGIHVFSADGNNVLKVYETMKKAVRYVRVGRGPVFIEFTTYRWREHCGPNFDNYIGYRSEKEFLEWKETDPVVRLKRHLENEAILTNDEFRALIQQLSQEIEEVFQKVKSSPLASKLINATDVYAQ